MEAREVPLFSPPSTIFVLFSALRVCTHLTKKTKKHTTTINGAWWVTLKSPDLFLFLHPSPTSLVTPLLRDRYGQRP